MGICNTSKKVVIETTYLNKTTSVSSKKNQIIKESNNKGKLSENLQRKLESYLSIHSKVKVLFEKVSEKLYEEIEKSIAIEEEDKFNDFISENKKIIEILGIKKSEIKNFCFDRIGKKSLEEKCMIKEWSVHNIIKEYVNNIKLEKDSNDYFLLYLHTNIPNSQIGLHYILPCRRDNLFYNYNRNIKFNQDYSNKLQLLNVEFSTDNPNPNLYEDIGEIIECCFKNLITLVINVTFNIIETDVNFENHNIFDKYYNILVGILNNKTIKYLALSFSENENYKFSEKIDKLFLEIIENNPISSLLIDGYSFNDNNTFLNFLKLMEINTTIKFLAINFIEDIVDILESIIFYFSRNKVIEFLIISSSKSLNDEKIKLFKEGCKNIIVCEFIKSYS